MSISLTDQEMNDIFHSLKHMRAALLKLDIPLEDLPMLYRLEVLTERIKHEAIAT